MFYIYSKLLTLGGGGVSDVGFLAKMKAKSLITHLLNCFTGNFMISFPNLFLSCLGCFLYEPLLLRVLGMLSVVTY